MASEAATVAEKLGDKALQYLNALEELTKQYAPDVVDAALAVVQISGAQGVVYGVAGIAFLALLWFKAWPPVLAQCRKGDKGDPAVQVCGTMGIACGAVFGAVVVAANLLSVWTWVALFNPKLYLAYKIFGKLL